MSARELTYAILAVLATIAGWYYNIQYYFQAGDAFGWMHWISQCFVNSAAASAFMDLTFGYIILGIWMVVEARRIGMRPATGWLYILLTLWISFGFGVALFLLFRERHLRLHTAKI
jgi:hypothetical protein